MQKSAISLKNIEKWRNQANIGLKIQFELILRALGPTPWAIVLGPHFQEHIYIGTGKCVRNEHIWRDEYKCGTENEGEEHKLCNNGANIV